MIQFLEALRKFLKSNASYFDYKYRLDDVMWIEHYSAKASMSNTAVYRWVELGDSWEPKWTPISLDELAKITGYSLEQLRIDDDKLDENAL